MNNRNLNKLIIFGILLLLATLFIDHKIEARSSYAHVNETNLPQQRPSDLKQAPQNIWRIMAHKMAVNSQSKKSSPILGAKETPLPELSKEDINIQLNAFFEHIDHQEYTKKYNFAQGAKNKVNQIIEILTQNSPVLIRETDSIYYLLRNYFYFYRLLGEDRIDFITDVAVNESENIEHLMYLFYIWLKENNINSGPNLVRPSFEQTYIYAHFFLETIGGRNYLFRRDPKIRGLASYYSVLIIDQANINGLNSNGTDIRPHLEHAIKGLENQIDLLYKKQYLLELENLSNKYNLS